MNLIQVCEELHIINTNESVSNMPSSIFRQIDVASKRTHVVRTVGTYARTHALLVLTHERNAYVRILVKSASEPNACHVRAYGGDL